MARFVTAAEIERLRHAPADSYQRRLYDALRKRAYQHTRHPGFVQAGDTQEWWHLCWERASDAAFVWYMERDEQIGQWIRDVAFWLCNIEDVEWQGPWFRGRIKPLVGYLETSHVALAMCEILDLCGELFTSE